MLAAGTMIDGKYRVVRLLGEGGMGEVYEAEHAFLERRVAIKILNPEFTRNDDAVRRFYREAQAAGRVGHENICEVIDIGQTVGGLPYIVMQLLVGRSLTQLIAESAPLPIGRTVDIADQALGALHAAHKAGIVHRDIKPDNIYLVSVGGRHDFVKLLDFGISKVRTLDGGDNVSVTRTGTVLGTPLYMSPEQARGDSDVDARTDVWSMGVITYEMLIGQPPFRGDNYNQVLFSVLNAPIASIRSQRAGVSRELDAVVMRALERDVRRRFESAQTFREALLGAWMSVGESGFALRASIPPGDPDLLSGDTAVGAYPTATSSEPSPAPAPAGADTAVSERMATVPLGYPPPGTPAPAPAAAPAVPAATPSVPAATPSVPAATPSVPAAAPSAPAAPAPAPSGPAGAAQEGKGLESSLDRLLREAIAPVVIRAAGPAQGASATPGADRVVPAPKPASASAAAPAPKPASASAAAPAHGAGVHAGIHAEKIQVGAGREVFVVKPPPREATGTRPAVRRAPKVEKTPGAVLADARTGIEAVPFHRRKVALAAAAAGALALVAVVFLVFGRGRSDSAGTVAAPPPAPAAPAVAASVRPDAGGVADGSPSGEGGAKVESVVAAGGDAAQATAPRGDGTGSAVADAGTSVPHPAALDEEVFPAELPLEAARLTASGADGVEVLMDGTYLGTVPFESLAVPPGEHRLTFVHLERRIRHEEVVEIRPGEEKRIHRTLAQLSGAPISRDAGVRRDAAADGGSSRPADAGRFEAATGVDAPAVRIRRDYGARPL